MTILFTILGICFTLLFVIGTHEAAHFMMARCLKVDVLRFSIGFGKTLLSWRDRKNTEYVLALIPLGGYVKMLDETEGTVPANRLPYAYNRQPIYKKILIVLAGPVMNLLCALLLYWMLFLVGFVTIKPVIGTIAPHSIAEAALLKPGQTIISVDHHNMLSWVSVMLRLAMHIGDHDQVHVVTTTPQHSQPQTHVLDLKTWKLDDLHPDLLTSLGITPALTPLDQLLVHIQYPPLAALQQAFHIVMTVITVNFVLCGKLVMGKLSIHSLGGPLMIFE